MVCRNVFPKNLSFDIVGMSSVIKIWIVESNVSLPFVVLTGYRRNFLLYYFPFHIRTRLWKLEHVNAHYGGGAVRGGNIVYWL